MEIEKSNPADPKSVMFYPPTYTQKAHAEAEEAFKKDWYSDRISNDDRNFIQKTLDGVRPSDDQIDAFLERNLGVDQDLTTDDESANERSWNTEVLFDYLRILREESREKKRLLDNEI